MARDERAPGRDVATAPRGLAVDEGLSGSTSVDGLNIAYRTAGDGPAVVLLHGVGSNSRSWRPQLGALSRNFRVIAWDAPGYGLSDDPPAPLAMAGYARYLAGLLDGLDLERAHVVGLSWGGVLAQEFYLHHSDRVLSLVLADSSVGGGSLSTADREQRLRVRLSPLDTMTPAEMARGMAPTLLSPDATADLVRAVESIVSEIHPDGYRSAVIAFLNADEREMLATIDVPTLVIWGERDGIASLSQSHHLHERIRDSSLVVIPGAGHLSNQERPDQFSDAVLAFLCETIDRTERLEGA